MMNLISKISFVISAISLITLAVARVFLGYWVDILWWPLGFFILSALVHFILSAPFYWSILRMKTTKEGMSLGLSVCILIVILSSVSIISVMMDKTFDLTKNKVNTLSEQSIKVLNSMKDDGLEFIVFYKGNEARERLKDARYSLKIYKQNAPYIKIRYVDAYVKNKMAKEYLQSISDKDHTFIFVKYKDKKTRVSHPFGESEILSALIKSSKDFTAYYTTGHGERDFRSTSEDGLSFLKQALEESSIQIKEWNFIKEQAPLPKEASVFLIIRPTQPFLEQEISWIKEYLENNGNLLIALDPGTSQNLTPFIKNSLGIEHKNNYLISKSPILTGGQLSVMGLGFDSENLITRSLGRNSSTLLTEASVVSIDPNINKNWQGANLMYAISSFTVSSLEDIDKPSRWGRGAEYYPVAAVVQNFSKRLTDNKAVDEHASASLPKEGFSAVVFGDSDFLSNRFFNSYVNKNLTLNTMAYLFDEGDLASLRPRQHDTTQIILTSSQTILLFSMIVFIPIIFFALAIIFWIRRKSA